MMQCPPVTLARVPFLWLALLAAPASLPADEPE